MRTAVKSKNLMEEINSGNSKNQRREPEEQANYEFDVENSGCRETFFLAAG
jgi:hypothetical protein